MVEKAERGWHRVLEHGIRYGLLSLLVWTPLAFGAVHTGAYALLQIHICWLVALGIVQYLVVLRQGQTAVACPPRLIGTPLALPLVLFLLLLLLQTAHSRCLTCFPVAHRSGIVSPVSTRLA